MTITTTTSSLALVPSLEKAWEDVDSSYERFCLTAGIGAMRKCCARTPSSSPARRIAAEEAASVTVGADQGQDWLPRRQGCGAPPPGSQL